MDSPDNPIAIHDEIVILYTRTVNAIQMVAISAWKQNERSKIIARSFYRI